MACSDVNMDIHRADKEPRRPNMRELPRIEYYEALEVLPDSKKPLHDLLQKQPAVLGVRNLTVLSTLSYWIWYLIICDEISSLKIDSSIEFDIFTSHIFCSDYHCKRSYQISVFKQVYIVKAMKSTCKHLLHIY